MTGKRILTTHTGSLPRPAQLLALLQAAERGETVDPRSLEAQSATAVAEIVGRQVQAGIDIVSDGEQSKPDYSTYIKTRLHGFAGTMESHPTSRDRGDFPEFFAESRSDSETVTRPCCDGPIRWRDFEAVKADIAHLLLALDSVGMKPDQAFMTSVSPGQAARFLGNRFYASHEDYLSALGAVLRDEYNAIVDAGFILQVDCPDLASGWNNQFADKSLEEFRSLVRLHLDVLDRATQNVPPERLRLHVCWGNYPGPHNHDIPLSEILDLILTSRATMVSFEGANPRHEHEWRAFQQVRLGQKKIIPGVIDSTSNFIEHPQVIADRIVRFAGAAGKERVIAGSDCGFATFAGKPTVHPSIVWAKLAALAEGARLASAELWPARSGGDVIEPA
jgi:5-methyltetrahydropteroyltriglutamate--homocysteine methyltransferase